MTAKSLRASGDTPAGSATILLTILPQWAEAILGGRKAWEYRRAAPRVDCRARIILYASGSTRAIVGECQMVELRRGPVAELAEATASTTPHSPAEIRAYFAGKTVGTALRVDRPVRYAAAIPLKSIQAVDPNFVVPQNFLYLRGDTISGAALLELLPAVRPTPLESSQTSLFSDQG